ncbi:hypothetical protein ABXI36_005371, partial [Salmonella enterica]
MNKIPAMNTGCSQKEIRGNRWENQARAKADAEAEAKAKAEAEAKAKAKAEREALFARAGVVP